jgi:hypothetical protein
MTPKEKANELIEKFMFNCRECDYEDNAKQCALIAVDEILDINSVDKDYELSNYWQEVKQEIENL